MIKRRLLDDRGDGEKYKCCRCSRAHRRADGGGDARVISSALWQGTLPRGSTQTVDVRLDSLPIRSYRGVASVAELVATATGTARRGDVVYLPPRPQAGQAGLWDMMSRSPGSIQSVGRRSAISRHASCRWRSAGSRRLCRLEDALPARGILVRSRNRSWLSPRAHAPLSYGPTLTPRLAARRAECVHSATTGRRRWRASGASWPASRRPAASRSLQGAGRRAPSGAALAP